MENIHIRLKEEIDRIGLSIAEAARQSGMSDSQGLRDVLSGRKRLSAEMLASLAANIGIDALYVLVGTARSQPTSTSATQLNPRERALLDNYRHTHVTQKKFIEDAALMASKQQKKTASGK